MPKAAPHAPARPRGTLFIVDRSVDPVAPWPHEFTYQAMVSDLLPLEDGLKYTSVSFPSPFLAAPPSTLPDTFFSSRTHRYDVQAAHGKAEKKTAVLAERDEVWTDVRHLHMRDAIDRLMADFNAFCKEHGGFSARSVLPLSRSPLPRLERPRR